MPTSRESRGGVALVVALVAGMAADVAVAAPKARLLTFGLFSADPVPESQQQSGPIGKYAHLASTRKIPLKLGVRFGFCAEISGLEVEGKYTLTEIVRHPVMTEPNGIESAGWNVPRMLKVQDGKGVWCGGYVFTKPHELVPGQWRFTVSDSDADLVVEAFEAVPAGGSGTASPEPGR